MEHIELHASEERPGLSRLLSWSGLAASVLAIAAFAVGATTLPRTGPFAAPSALIPYPYAEAARFVPADFIWMYVALPMILAYLFMSVCLREGAPSGSRVWATFGLVLATAAFAALSIDYFVQIFTIQPALLNREAADVVALSQYNPHGLFISVENFGYLAMALSFGAFASTLGGTRTRTAAKWVFATAAVLAPLALVLMTWAFGMGLEYRFEVAAIVIDYFALAVGGALIAVPVRKPVADVQTS